jgi:hypothetical protein
MATSWSTVRALSTSPAMVAVTLPQTATTGRAPAAAGAGDEAQPARLATTRRPANAGAIVIVIVVVEAWAAGLDRQDVGTHHAAVTCVLKNSILVVLLALAIVVVGCAHDTPSLPAPTGPPPAARPLVDGPIVAMRGIDAPGYSLEDLTARLREAFVHTSGVVVVDEPSVRAELAACVEMPCADTQQVRFRDATIVVSTTLSKVGPTVLGSLRVSKGLKEIARINVQGNDAAVVVTSLGHQGGAALRTELTTVVPDTTPGPPSVER